LNRKRIGISFLCASGVILASIVWVDSAVASFFDKFMPLVSPWLDSHKAEVPDLLLPMTIGISAVSWAGYGWLSSRRRNLPLTRMLAVIGLSCPLSFAVKAGLQHLFSRIGPNEWLGIQNQAQFRFLAGIGTAGAFPSGHMAVFTPLLIALYRIFPSLRSLWLALWLALAMALVTGNYHFVSDVIAGAYIGFLLHIVAFKWTYRFANYANLPAPLTLDQELADSPE
jgi:membrane-associated phospholipid phosphatase